MRVLVPLLTGKENNKQFIEAFTNKVDEVFLLQIVDKEFMNKTSTAIGEVRQLNKLMEEIRRTVGLKKKRCVEITEWGSTIKKILAIVVLQKIDKVFLVKEDTQFFGEVTRELKKNRVPVEVIDLVEEIIVEDK